MKSIFLIALIVFACPLRALAQTTQPTITLTTGVEDGKKIINALVMANGKPSAGLTLQFFVRRMFGTLKIGEDTTLDDGTCAVAFPSDLRGSSDGMLHVNARVKTPAAYASVSAAAVFDADAKLPPQTDAFPRALWAPQAPLPLLLTIVLLVAGIWSCYAFVIHQVWSIRKGAEL